MARILIVDDHVETCRVMAMLVKHLGHEAHSLFNGHDAIDFLRRSPTDLVILDIMMPGISGMDVLKQLRADPATSAVPVVMMTAVTDPLTRAEAISLGANDYWIKATVDVPELERRINRHIKEGDHTANAFDERAATDRPRATDRLSAKPSATGWLHLMPLWFSPFAASA